MNPGPTPGPTPGTSPRTTLGLPARLPARLPAGEVSWDALPAPGPVVARVARAYCGPAHGRTWAVVVEGPPPAIVDVRLETSAQTLQYRLVHHPRTRRPVRDHEGSYLYMPVRTAALSLAAPRSPMPTPPIELDVRLPVQQRVRELVVRACEEPAARSAFGADPSLIR